MKSLKLGSVSFNGQEVKHSELLKSCVNNPPQGGFTPDEMRKRLRVADAIEKAEESLELEDADAECLKKCVAEMRWSVASKDILALCDAVASL